jgi:metacaspase-1
MKIIGSRFRVRGRRHQPPLLPTVDENNKAIQDAVGPSVARTIRKRALLIGVQQLRSTELEPAAGLVSPLSPLPGQKRGRRKGKGKKLDTAMILKGPHRDVLAMKGLLVDIYKYDPNDIAVLIDDDDPNHIQPTRENILAAIADLVDDARENDRFFFHFSGHSTQEDTDDIEEEDRMNEFIVASDGDTIKDDELREHLVKPLPPKSSLIAVFDSCHSGTLLDLKHFRCNQVYVPWLNKGHRRTNSLWNTNHRRQAKISFRAAQELRKLNSRLLRWTRTSMDGLMLPTDEPHEPESTAAPVVAKKKTPLLSVITDCLPSPVWLDSSVQRCSSPEMLYCTGDCRNNSLWQQDSAEQADVISLSSAQDGQKSWEDADGMSMTQALVKILSKNPHPSLHSLLSLVSHDLHKIYLTLHFKAREYRKQIQDLNRERIKKGKKPRRGDSVEMNNFQNPTLSSDRPLDMSRTWYP